MIIKIDRYGMSIKGYEEGVVETNINEFNDLKIVNPALKTKFNKNGSTIDSVSAKALNEIYNTPEKAMKFPQNKG
jgi:hypothetical protein